MARVIYFLKSNTTDASCCPLALVESYRKIGFFLSITRGNLWTKNNRNGEHFATSRNHFALNIASCWIILYTLDTYNWDLLTNGYSRNTHQLVEIVESANVFRIEEYLRHCFPPRSLADLWAAARVFVEVDVDVFKSKLFKFGLGPNAKRATSNGEDYYAALHDDDSNCFSKAEND